MENKKKGVVMNMKTETWMEEYLKSGRQDSLLLKGAAQMAEAADGGVYMDYLKNAEPESKAEYGSVYSFLYKSTGEQKYLETVETLKAGLQEEPGDKDGSLYYKLGSMVELEGMYRILPFYMECETKYGKKEQYNHIIGQFDKVQEKIYSADGGLLVSDLEQVSYDMMALVDVMDCMSIEIYEQYRKLQDYYKALLKEMLGKKEQWSTAVKICVAYTMLKACRMELLLKEKYAQNAMELLETCAGQLSEETDAKTAGMFFLAYAQEILLKKQMETLGL